MNESNGKTAIVAYRGVPHAIGFETGARIAATFEKRGFYVHRYGTYYKSREKIDKRELPKSADILLYCECNDDDPQYTELKNYPAKKKAFWIFDIDNHPQKIYAFIKFMGFDAVFFGNIFYEKALASICRKSFFLPYACDSAIHKNMPEVEKTIDVGIIGSPYKKRIELVEKIKSCGINAKLISNVFGDEMIKTLNSFKINLNYMVGGGRGLLNGRVFETIGCGVLLLNENEDGIWSILKDGENVVLYSSEDDCISKIKYYLSHKDEAARIARNGHLEGITNQTFDNRAEFIESKLAEDAAKNKLKIFPKNLSFKDKLRVLIFYLKLAVGLTNII